MHTGGERGGLYTYRKGERRGRRTEERKEETGRKRDLRREKGREEGYECDKNSHQLNKGKGIEGEKRRWKRRRMLRGLVERD